jgi:hypothetical protein
MSRPLHELDLDTLPVEEFMRRYSEAVSQDAIDGTHELVEWFMRRYPTAKERFTYIRKARARLARAERNGQP